jgi:hypothetical protein
LDLKERKCPKTRKIYCHSSIEFISLCLIVLCSVSISTEKQEKCANC